MCKQCFFLVGHTVNNQLTMDKVFLQLYQADKYGRTMATKNKDYQVRLFVQEITTNGAIKHYRDLKPYYELK